MWRVVPGLAVWSGIYLAWYYRHRGGIAWSVGVERALAGPVANHLWFVYLIIGLYFLAPIIAAIIKNDADGTMLRYFLVVWFVAACVLPFVESIYGYKVGIHFHNIRYYIGYFVLGVYALQTTVRPRIIYALGVLGFVVTFLGSYWVTVSNGGTWTKTFYGYMSPFVVMMSLAVFIWIKNVDWDAVFGRFPRVRRHVVAFSRHGYGIYLAHILVLEILVSEYVPFRVDAFLLHPIVGIPVTIVVCTAVCYCSALMFDYCKTIIAGVVIRLPAPMET